MIFKESKHSIIKIAFRNVRTLLLNINLFRKNMSKNIKPRSNMFLFISEILKDRCGRWDLLYYFNHNKRETNTCLQDGYNTYE